MVRRKPIVCVDFDGVIHGYQSGWLGAGVITDTPVPGAIDALLRLWDAGFNVAIYSARSSSFAGRRAMKRWMREALQAHWASGKNILGDLEAECMGDAGEAVRYFSWPWFKPSAQVTIDDRAITFEGDWSDPRFSAEGLRAFKPWNKR